MTDLSTMSKCPTCRVPLDNELGTCPNEDCAGVVYEVQGDYGRGFREVTSELTQPAAKAMAEAYREHRPDTRFRVRRVARTTPDEVEAPPREDEPTSGTLRKEHIATMSLSRNFHCPQQLWDTAKAKAKAQGTSVALVLRRALVEYVLDEETPRPEERDMTTNTLTRTIDRLIRLSNEYDNLTGQQSYLYCSVPEPGDTRFVFTDRTLTSQIKALQHMQGLVSTARMVAAE